VLRHGRDRGGRGHAADRVGHDARRAELGGNAAAEVAVFSLQTKKRKEGWKRVTQKGPDVTRRTWTCRRTVLLRVKVRGQ